LAITGEKNQMSDLAEGCVRLRIHTTTQQSHTDINVNEETIISHHYQDGAIFTLTAEAHEDLVELDEEQIKEQLKNPKKEEERIVRNEWDEE